MTGSVPKAAADNSFRRAAETVAMVGRIDAPETDPKIMAFLASVGLLPKPGETPDADRRQHHIRMLDVAASLGRFFRLDSPFAPRAFFCGGMDAGGQNYPAGSYAGRGFDLGQAFLSCVGEAAEYRAMFLRPDDPRVRDSHKMAGTSLTADRPVDTPVAACLRDPKNPESGPSSTGYAAGPSLAAAIESALLECVERDAIARWALGEVVPEAIAIDAALAQSLSGIGRTATRPVEFADLSPPGALAHSVVAVSTDAGSLGTAFGFGAAFSRLGACRKALLELCQGEIGLLMIAAKRRERADGSLSAKEAEAVARSEAYHTGDRLLTFRMARKSREEGLPQDFAAAIAAARSMGKDIAAFDLTVPGEDIPVAKVSVDGLFDAAILPSNMGLPSLL